MSGAALVTGGGGRRVGIALMGCLVALTTFLLASPLPRGLDGATFCLPFVGPVTRIDLALPPDAQRLVKAHEMGHAASCRRRGAIGEYFSRLTVRGRLDAEVQAYCSQGRFEVRAGGVPRLVWASVLDQLEEGHRGLRELGRPLIANRLVSGCHDAAVLSR
ncbi:MAG TPA: hypothetical protein VHE78_10565 [Gemmatimonadaceae bacterium]|nr:hypothetical protein [Gemmatimonadaceae bacterium]